MRLSARSGFTLIELMVSITIIMILSAIVLANLSGAGARGRDLDRQADLRALQTAIENYKRDHGRYPAMGCFTDYTTDADNFSSEEDCENYITGATINGVVEPFVPNYIDRLPRDPRRDAGEQGFAYITNPAGTVYKIMAMRTVESEQVTYTHPFRSCAINANSSGNLPGISANPTTMTAINTQGWCAYIHYTDLDNNPVQGYLADCLWRGVSLGSGVTGATGNYRFDTSYGLWGGFEPLIGGLIRQQVGETTKVICE